MDLPKKPSAELLALGGPRKACEHGPRRADTCCAVSRSTSGHQKDIWKITSRPLALQVLATPRNTIINEILPAKHHLTLHLNPPHILCTNSRGATPRAGAPALLTLCVAQGRGLRPRLRRLYMEAFCHYRKEAAIPASHDQQACSRAATAMRTRYLRRHMNTSQTLCCRRLLSDHAHAQTLDSSALSPAV